MKATLLDASAAIAAHSIQFFHRLWRVVSVGADGLPVAGCEDRAHQLLCAVEFELPEDGISECVFGNAELTFCLGMRL